MSSLTAVRKPSHTSFRMTAPPTLKLKSVEVASNPPVLPKPPPGLNIVMPLSCCQRMSPFPTAVPYYSSWEAKQPWLPGDPCSVTEQKHRDSSRTFLYSLLRCLLVPSDRSVPLQKSNGDKLERIFVVETLACRYLRW